MTIPQYARNAGTTTLLRISRIRLLAPVIRDLNKVHGAGIIHRDISPDNLMVSGEGKVMLLDLGAAKDLKNGSGQSSLIVYKRGYSPLEQYSRNSRIGPWTDVYAMSATIYWCLTGEIIPEAPERMVRDTLTFPQSIPSNVVSVLRHGLAVRSDERIQDCLTLVTQLENAVQKKREVPPPSVSRKSASRDIAREYKNTFSQVGKDIEKGNLQRSSNEPEKLTDSWVRIIASSSDGSYKKRYRIGDMKELNFGREGIIRMKLVAMDEDELADGSGKAPMTWVADELLKSEHNMNDKGTNKGGWETSGMRAWLRETVLPLMPEEVRNGIREVTKYSYSYEEQKGVITTDTIWIPSAREVFLADDPDWVNNYREKEGAAYTEVFKDDDSRVRSRAGASGTSRWWLRSASLSSVYLFLDVISDGSHYRYDAIGERGVLVGFCL